MSIHTHTLDNGLHILIEPMAGVASAALYWLVPAGCAHDAPHAMGQAAMFEEFLSRGCGTMTSRQHSDALDRLGVQRSSDVGSHHVVIAATMLGSNIADALPLLTSMALDPAYNAEQLDAAKSLCVQAIESLRDDPQHYVMLQLRDRHLPAPLNRHGYGEIAGIEPLTIDDLRAAWKMRAVPHGSILAVTGDVNTNEIFSRLNELLGQWSGREQPIESSNDAAGGMVHVEEPTAQVHLGIACDAPRESECDSAVERIAIGVLSGGMSGRLFTEVREKRSLCYSVNASYRSGRDHGWLTIYAGTTPDRAQETLDVCIGELERLSQGVSEDEFRRAVIGLKSRLIMQGESTAARAAAHCRDQFRIGRPRTLDEIAKEIEAVTLDRLNEYLQARDFGPYTVATLGPNVLTHS